MPPTPKGNTFAHFDTTTLENDIFRNNSSELSYYKYTLLYITHDDEIKCKCTIS